MTVNTSNAVNVSISATATTVCSGTSVTFTANPTNGGTTPAYQWKKGGVSISGATNVTYAYTPAQGDLITCQLTSNVACPTGNPATSNVITMTVTNPLPVSVSITASGNNVCSGANVTFTATPVNGGTSPAYQWKKGGSAISGATAATYAYVPINGDVITCTVTSNATCVSGSPATSNAITMTVIASSAVSLTISTPLTTLCSGSSATYTAAPVNGGTTPGYQWMKGSANITGATNVTYSYTPANGDVISCTLTSNIACATGSPATSNAITMAINAPVAVGVTISPSANNVCEGTSVTFTATPANGGTSPAYQWKKGGTDISGATNVTYAYTPVSGDVITCQLTSNASCVTGNPALSSATTMTVTQPLPVSVSISASANNICAGTNVTFTATPTNGGTTPAYQWKKGGVNISGATAATYSYAPANNDVITCTLTSNATCISGNPATSAAITMAVTANSPVSISIAASGNNICAGTQVTFTATPVNGGTAPAYQWVKGTTNISGATNATYTYTPVNGEAITCRLTSNIVCPSGNPATSNGITMIVNPLLTVSVSIVASSNPSCNGSNVTFTATPVNGGTTPVYQWKVNGSIVTSATNSTYTFIPTNGNTVQCLVTSNATCPSGSPATSNTITMTVDPLQTISVSVAATATTVCAGTSVTFTATPTNGGTSPAYQWIVNGNNVSGATSSAYSYAPVNGDLVKCQMTSSVSCPSVTPAISNVITMTVNPANVVSVTLAASAYAVVTGTSVTFTATPTNGGTAPYYVWKKNGVTVGGNTNTYSYAPANNDNVYCIMTSSLTTCVTGSPATSNTVNMIVYTSGTACNPATVTHGGQTYNTVVVGTQCWLRENLNIGTMITGATNQTNNSIIEKFCFLDDPNYCNVYGGLYQWGELVQYLNNASNTTHWNPAPTGVVQGLCPTGFHIPTNSELTTLFTFLGGITVAGGKLKEIAYVHWNSPNTSAGNTYGFTALPHGNVYQGVFQNLRQYGHHWTASTGTTGADAYIFGCSYNSSSRVWSETAKINGYGVRCIKD
jgi:uncharacterized protein (TIGR02145 family)